MAVPLTCKSTVPLCLLCASFLDDYNQVVMKPSEKLKERHLYLLHRVYVVPIHFKYVRSLKNTCSRVLRS